MFKDQLSHFNGFGLLFEALVYYLGSFNHYRWYHEGYQACKMNNGKQSIKFHIIYGNKGCSGRKVEGMHATKNNEWKR